MESLGVTEEIQNLETSSESNESQEKVKVAILDSGIDFSENINVVERKNFMDDEVSPLYEDNTGHGTAIAGIIASSGEDGMVKGVNPNVEIYSARILDTDNKAPISRVVESIYWAIEEDVDIINISFGTTVNSEILHNAIKDATDAGMLVFAASGNQGEDEGSTVEYPAAYEEVLAVGATNPDGKVADMTSTGEELDIVAPGINIHSVGWLDMEVVCNGTSMAVPHAVGAASLLWEMDKDKTADFIKGLLEASAKTVEDDGKEYSYIDVEYAREIYDEYSEKYTASEDVEELNELYENDDEVEAYDEAVVGNWKKVDHEETVEHANYSVGGLSSTELVIVKKGVRAPDELWKSSDGFQYFHAVGEYNYIKVYEYLMSMALQSAKKNFMSSKYINFPDNDAGKLDECCEVNRNVNESDIKKIVGKNSITGKEAALALMGMAMHVVGDVYAHKAYYRYDNNWVKITNEDDRTYRSERYVYAKFAIINVLKIWNNKGKPSFKELNVQGHSSQFRLKKLYTHSKNSPNGINFNSYSEQILRLSCKD